MKRALTQAFIRVDEDLTCEFHVTTKNNYLNMKIAYLFCLTILIGGCLIGCNNKTKTDVSENSTEKTQPEKNHHKFKFLMVNGKFIIGSKEVSVKNIEVIDYAQFDTIKESCKNIIFSDSILRSWNKACLVSVIKEYEKYEEKRLIRTYLNYQRGHYFHLDFAKFINDQKLLNKSDFVKGFYIIEEVHSGSSMRNYITLIRKTKESTLNCSVFKFSGGIEWTWKPTQILNPNGVGTFNKPPKDISENKFKKWLSKIKRIDNENSSVNYNNISDFVVTEFNSKTINSYYFDFAPIKLYSDFEKMINDK